MCRQTHSLRDLVKIFRETQGTEDGLMSLTHE
jgi:hypothetical protein